MMSTMTRAAEPVGAAFQRREPHYRTCRDETVHILVNRLLDWHGVPIIVGRSETHLVTYADILRILKPLNEGRDQSKSRTQSGALPKSTTAAAGLVALRPTSARLEVDVLAVEVVGGPSHWWPTTPSPGFHADQFLERSSARSHWRPRGDQMSCDRN
jgi:hypothetical protein